MTIQDPPDLKIAPLFEKIPGKMPNGTFTVIGPKGHRTIRVSTILDKESPLYGRRKISVFIGRDNTEMFAYKGVGFLDTDDKGVDTFKVWQKQAGTANHKIVQAFWQVFHKADNTAWERKWKEYRIEEARNCMLCNHLLTNPESIERGIGPVCGKDENGS